MTVNEHLKEKITTSIESAAGEKIKKAVNEFLDAEIIPEVKKNLITNKVAILEELNKSCTVIATEMVKTLTAKTVTNLSRYKGTEILKKLMD